MLSEPKMRGGGSKERFGIEAVLENSEQIATLGPGRFLPVIGLGKVVQWWNICLACLSS